MDKPELKAYLEQIEGTIIFNNCLTWALWQWFTKGGYLAIRASHSRWYPHFLWIPCEGSDMYHLVPVRQQYWPWPIFKGRVKKKDWTPEEAEECFKRTGSH